MFASMCCCIIVGKTTKSRGSESAAEAQAIRQRANNIGKTSCLTIAGLRNARPDAGAEGAPARAARRERNSGAVGAPPPAAV
jgi:hypothetical protein